MFLFCTEFSSVLSFVCIFFFFFNDTATTEIYTYCHTLSLHDALPISSIARHSGGGAAPAIPACRGGRSSEWPGFRRSRHHRRRRSRTACGHAAQRRQIGRAHV